MSTRLLLEAMEDRTVPSHLGVQEIELQGSPPPNAIDHAAVGIARANDTPTHETPNGAETPHARKLIIIWI